MICQSKFILTKGKYILAYHWSFVLYDVIFIGHYMLLQELTHSYVHRVFLWDEEKEKIIYVEKSADSNSNKKKAIFPWILTFAYEFDDIKVLVNGN